MSVGNLLCIHPSELQFPIELRKQNSCSMHFTNKSDQYVAFKVKTTNPKKYLVRPNRGIIMPGASCNVIVIMQALKQIPDMQCTDKFLIQSTAAPDGSSSKDLTPDTFVKMDGNIVEEFKLRVVCIPANPPSPVPEESKEDSFLRYPLLENVNWDASHLETAPILDHIGDRSSETWSTISKLLRKKLTFCITTSIHNSNWIRQPKMKQS